MFSYIKVLSKQKYTLHLCIVYSATNDNSVINFYALIKFKDQSPVRKCEKHHEGD